VMHEEMLGLSTRSTRRTYYSPKSMSYASKRIGNDLRRQDNLAGRGNGIEIRRAVPEATLGWMSLLQVRFALFAKRFCRRQHGNLKRTLRAADRGRWYTNVGEAQLVVGGIEQRVGSIKPL